MTRRSVPPFALALLTGAAWLAAPQPVRAQQPEAAIEILEPAAWRSVDTRGGIRVKERTSLKVLGVAYAPSGVDRVTLNGADAALEPMAQGDRSSRFTGYAHVAANVREVLVEAWSGGEVVAARRYPVEVAPSAGTYPDPATAWEDGAGFRGNRWAVVVGISEYADGSIPALRYADDDARAFYQFLVSEQAGLGGFEPGNIRLLVDGDATYRALRLAFRDFLKSATEDDVVVIFFAGHGAPDPERPEDLYLFAHDTEVGSVAGTGFPMQDVHDAIQRTRARTVISFVDACHSAGVGGQVGLRAVSNPINDAFLRRARESLGVTMTFTASQVSQYSQEGPQWGGGHGVFTYHLLRALDGEADGDADGIVTLGESLEWTREQVRRDTRNGQIPSISQTAFDPSWPMSIARTSAVVAAEPGQAEGTPPAGVRPDPLTPGSPSLRADDRARSLIVESAAAFADLLTNGQGAALRAALPTEMRDDGAHGALLGLLDGPGGVGVGGDPDVSDVRFDGTTAQARVALPLRWTTAFGSARSRTVTFALSWELTAGQWRLARWELLTPL